MIDMHSNYDNMHKNRMFYALIYINNHIITSINCMFPNLDESFSKIQNVSNLDGVFSITLHFIVSLISIILKNKV